MVRGAPRAGGARALERLLVSAGVAFAPGSVRKDHGKNYGFVTFGWLEDRKSAERLLAAGGGSLTLTSAAPRGGSSAAASAGGDTAAEAESRARRDVRDAVTPLWRLPYLAQLLQKRGTVAAALQRLSANVQQACGGGGQVPAWVGQAASRDGLACPLVGVVASPVLAGYRNKSEFTIGPGADGALTVGFNVGLFSEGFAAVSEPAACANVSAAAQALAAWTQAHLRAHSSLPAWDKRAGGGFWRLLLVREGGLAQVVRPDWRKLLVQPQEVGSEVSEVPHAHVLPRWQGQPPIAADAEVLVVVQVSARGRDHALVRSECTSLAAHLRAAAAAADPPMPLVALILQLHDGCSNCADAGAVTMPLEAFTPAPPSAPPLCITERMCGLRFRVSAESFFQVNTAAAEALYDLAGEWASQTDAADANALLIDVCCGTGTIGLTLASRFASVVGVDICESAVRDAAANAELNGVLNARFVAGKAEAVLPPLLRDADPSQPCVAIVDPPRGGLHKSVMGALRRCSQLKRLVYVSCNAATLADNCVVLCSPAGPGAPFSPVKAAALDLFPGTPHIEAVLVLERQ